MSVSHSDRARLLVNPAAGRGGGGRALPRLRHLAQKEGLRLEISRSPAALRSAAERAVTEGAERLLVAGGDGTVHHAVQALARSDTALGILPLGSGNDLAATVGVPRRLAAAFRAAIEGPVRRLDLGCVDGCWFAGVAGVGFDGEVARVAAERVRLVRGPLMYPWAVVRALAGFRPPVAVLEHEGPGGSGRFEGRVVLAAFGNTHRFGGGMRIAPDARPDDGLLDVVVVEAMSKPRLLRLFPRVYRGTHLGLPEVTTLQARRLRLGLDREMTVYGDGEPMRPVRGGGAVVEVVPGALRVVSPP